MEALVHPPTAAVRPQGEPSRSRRALRELAGRAGGSLLVSAATTAWSLSLLVTLTRSRALSAGPANVVATLSGIPWSYWLNRRFVWRRRGGHRVGREVAPFVAMCLVALVASTAAVTVADRLAASEQVLGWWRTAVVVGANVAAFGSLWLVQFLLLDRVLFARRSATIAPRPNGPKVHGGSAVTVRTLNSGVGTSPTRDVEPSGWAGDEESERGS